MFNTDYQTNEQRLKMKKSVIIVMTFSAVV
jgi:hypothetical protein